MEEIVSHNIEAFRASRLVAKKTLLNDHVGLSALWTWAMKEGLANENDARKVPRPRPEKKAIKPYLHNDVCEMLKALTHSRSYFRPSKKETKHKLLHADSNRAIILLLLDLGIREYSQKPRISMANGNQQFDSGTVFLVNETR